MAVLEVKNLRTFFHTRHGIVKAVDDVSYSLEQGEVLGVVGESGSGKSVCHRTLMGLLPMPPAVVEGGQAILGDKDLLRCSKEEMRQIRGKQVSMIFQDPMTCLNPYLRIGTQLIEPLMVHEDITKYDAMKVAAQSLKEVGIIDAEDRLNSYPHQFSGGMRQRVMIAMALITNPKILIADEPTTALDVTVEAQILDLIKKKQEQMGMSVIYITHNLSVIAGIADRIIVMYAGKISETGTADDIFYKSNHPYTKALLNSLPSTHEKGDELYTIPGLPPDVSKDLKGCRFSPRWEHAEDGCMSQEMILKNTGGMHSTACVRVQNGNL